MAACAQNLADIEVEVNACNERHVTVLDYETSGSGYVQAYNKLQPLKS